MDVTKHDNLRFPEGIRFKTKLDDQVAELKRLILTCPIGPAIPWKGDYWSSVEAYCNPAEPAD